MSRLTRKTTKENIDRSAIEQIIVTVKGSDELKRANFADILSEKTLILGNVTQEGTDEVTYDVVFNNTGKEFTFTRTGVGTCLLTNINGDALFRTNLFTIDAYGIAGEEDIEPSYINYYANDAANTAASIVTYQIANDASPNTVANTVGVISDARYFGSQLVIKFYSI